MQAAEPSRGGIGAAITTVTSTPTLLYKATRPPTVIATEAVDGATKRSPVCDCVVALSTGSDRSHAAFCSSCPYAHSSSRRHELLFGPDAR